MSLQNKKFYPYLFIVMATVLIGMSGPIAKFMDLYPPFVIWARCVTGYITLIFINFFISGKVSVLPLRNGVVLLTGLLMCCHWVLFFYSIQYGSVAVAIVSVFTYPLQSIFLEYFIHRKPVEKSYVIIGILVITGVYLLSPEFSLSSNQTLGLVLGLLSGLLLASRNIISARLMEVYSPSTLHISQVLISGILLIPFAWSENYGKVTENLIPLLSLGILTTGVGHLLFMNSLRHFSASEAGLLNGAQPVTAIMIAVVLVKEVPSFQVLAGTIIILASVMYAVFQISSKNR